MAERNYISSESSNLFVGDLRFDAIRIFGTGEYRMSSPQILEVIQVDRTWFATLGRKNGISLKTLREMDLTTLGKPGLWVQYTVEGTVTRAESRSLEEADEAWEYFAEKGNKQAKLILRALRRDSLRDRFDQVFEKPRATVEERRDRDSRILNASRTYEALYAKEMCDTAFAWFGCSFYWDYLYCWMTTEERCKLEQNNPSVNGRRNEYIHQWLPEDIRESLKGQAAVLLELLTRATSKQDFQGMYERIYGQGWQPTLF